MAYLSDLCCRLLLVPGLSVFTVISLERAQLYRDNVVLWNVFILLVRLLAVMEQNISYRGLPVSPRSAQAAGSVVLRKRFKQDLLFLSAKMSLIAIIESLPITFHFTASMFLFSFFHTYDTVTLPCSVFTAGFLFFKCHLILPLCQNAKCQEHSNNGETTALLFFTNPL